MNLPFIQARRERWLRLETLLKKADKSKLTSFTAEELIELGVLYRQTAGDLAQAKSQQLPAEVTDFINDLTARAYHRVYRAEKTTWRKLLSFFHQEFPRLFRKNYRTVLFTLTLLLFGWSLGFFGYLVGPETVHRFLPKKFATELFNNYLNNTWFNNPLAARPYLSSWIMINNIQVALTAFTGGMLLGLLTCFIVIYNGFILGVLAAFFWEKNYFLSFWAMILPHGVIELTAIGLAAAAGFLLAKAILFPGEYSRSDALKIYGHEAIKLMFGTAFLLVIAALIEGFFSTISTKLIPETLRLIFAGFTGVLLFWYLKSGQKNRVSSVFATALVIKSKRTDVF